jgi:hypothetical protein
LIGAEPAVTRTLATNPPFHELSETVAEQPAGSGGSLGDGDGGTGESDGDGGGSDGDGLDGDTGGLEGVLERPLFSSSSTAV